MLYQDNNNNVKNILDLKECIQLAEKEGFKKLTESQLKAYNDKPLAGNWNGNEWIKDIPECEEIRIEQINSKQDEIITKKTMYPIYKQLNIDNQLEPYTFEDKEIKNMFILTVRLIGRQAKENGTFVDDIDWAGLDKIESPSSINFEDTKAIKTRVLEELENAN